MSLPQVEIEIQKTERTVMFVFKPPEVASIMTLAVVEDGNTTPVWWLVPEAAIHEFPFTLAETTRTSEVVAGDVPQGGGKEEWMERKLMSAPSNRPLRIVVYGEVPQGLRQALPKQGVPPPLQPGHKYSVAVLGACTGQATFEA